MGDLPAKIKKNKPNSPRQKFLKMTIFNLLFSGKPHIKRLQN